MVFFFFTWLTHPGYLEKPKNNLLALLELHEASSICADCEIIKPERSKHCEICKRCVKVYDHVIIFVYF